jgi:hypothetical protein
VVLGVSGWCALRVGRGRPAGWLAGVAAGVVLVLVVVPGGGGTVRVPARGQARPRLWALPTGAWGPVSAALGRDDRAYLVRGLAAWNPSQRLALRFTPVGVVVGSSGAGARLGLWGVGRPGAMVSLRPASPRVAVNRVSYAWGPVGEWFVNGPLGVEQGFDLSRRPAGRGPLRLLVAVSGAVAVRGNGRRSALISLRDGEVIRYRGVWARDARGRRLRAWLAVAASQLSVFVDDRGARYPMRVDPFIQQGAKLVGSGASAVAGQGVSVALSGDGSTALVGGSGDDNDRGAAWVFTRTDGVWSQQAKLVASGAVGEADQGFSVALSGDGSTALIGGFHDNNFAGAGWVFTRTDGVWSQQAKLVAADAIANAEQGFSVALSGDGNTALIGGPGGVEPGAPEGAAWVFTRANGVWVEQSKLVGSGVAPYGGGFAGLGSSVALSSDGDTALIGGPDDDPVGAAWVFARSNGVWGQQGSKLVGSGATAGARQGLSVALSGDGSTALIGGRDDNAGVGAAWVFARSNGVWSQQGSKLVGSGATGKAEQGSGVALSGDGSTALIGGRDDNGGVGAAWMFARSNGIWSQQGAKLVGSGAVAYPGQGYSVALSGDASTALSGGGGDDRGRGATWVFVPGQAVAQPSNRFTISHIRTFVDGTVRFSVTVPGPGRIDVLETAWNTNLASVAVRLQPARRRFVFTRAQRTASRAGTLRVTAPPDARGRLLVTHHAYRVTLRLWVSYTPTAGKPHSIGFYGLHLPAGCSDPDNDGDCDMSR